MRWERLDVPFAFTIGADRLVPEQHTFRQPDGLTVTLLEGVASDLSVKPFKSLRGTRDVQNVYAPDCRLVPRTSVVPLLLDHAESMQVGTAEVWQDGTVIRFKAELDQTAPRGRETLEEIKDGTRACVSLGFAAPGKVENFSCGVGLVRIIEPAELSIVRAGANPGAYIRTVDGAPIGRPQPIAEREERDERQRSEVEADKRAADAWMAETAGDYAKLYDEVMAEARRKRWGQLS
jgi:hypothetical protein